MIAIFPELAACAATGDVERLSVLVRRYFGGPETHAPAPSLVTLLERAGLVVRTLPLAEQGALVAKDERGAFSIVAIVGEHVEPQARRFLLAHLLGHHLLDVQPLIARGDWQVSGFRETSCPLRRFVAGGAESGRRDLDLAREVRADQFAAALLLPRGMVRRALEKLGEVEKVAAFFGVSRACLSRRLQDMGLAPSGPVNFLDAERRIGGDGHNASQAAHAAPETTLQPPVDGVLPRAYAASTYGAMQQGARRGEQQAPASGRAAARRSPRPDEAPAREAAARAQPPTAPRVSGGAAPEPAAESAAERPAASGAGMERLRELARRLDKGVPSKR